MSVPRGPPQKSPVVVDFCWGDLVAAFRAAHGAAALSERRRGKEAYSEEPLPGFELAV